MSQPTIDLENARLMTSRIFLSLLRIIRASKRIDAAWPLCLRGDLSPEQITEAIRIAADLLRIRQEFQRDFTIILATERPDLIRSNVWSIENQFFSTGASDMPLETIADQIHEHCVELLSEEPLEGEWSEAPTHAMESCLEKLDRNMFLYAHLLSLRMQKMHEVLVADA